MKKNISIIFILFVTSILLIFVGCIKKSSPESNQNATSITAEITETTSSYKKMSAKDAKKTMDELEDFILLDVRTEAEYAEGHIEGAILIPDYEISNKAEELLPDKDKHIFVYCRSGRRSAGAANALIKLGYTNVIDFGGINDWPLETVK